MNALSKHTVVNVMTTELAERRRTAHARRAAYLALAEAILADEHDAYRQSPAHDRPRTARLKSVAAA